MTKNTASRIARLMDNARAAGYIVTSGRDDEYGRDWWDIIDHVCPDLASLHILIMSDADGWCVAGEHAAGEWRSLAEAEREVERWAAA